MNYIKPAINSRSISPTPFIPRSTQNRPSTQETSFINHSLPPKIQPNEAAIKLKPYGQSNREGSPPKTQKILGKTQYQRPGQSIINESDLISFVYEDSLNSSYYNLERFRVDRESVDYKEVNRENKFKTLNVRGEYSTIVNLEDKAKFSKMNTLIPGEHNGSKDFKQRVQEQIRKNLKKTDHSKESIQRQSSKFQKLDSTTYTIKAKDPSDQPAFPTISQIKKNSSKEDAIHPTAMIYNPPLPKSRDTSNLRNDDSRRTKSSTRHASVLRSRVPLDHSRRAISNQKGSKEGISPVIIRIDESENRNMKFKYPNEHLDVLNASAADVLRDASPQPVPLGNRNAKVYYPRPPSQDRTMKRRNSKSLVRPNNIEHLKERGHENKINPVLKTRENNLTVNIITENTNTQPNLITDYSINNTQIDDQKPISHYRTQPLLEDQTLKSLTPLQNNKSRDDGLRKTVDSQHEISYVEKVKLPEKGSEIQISNNFVVSPPVEIKRGRFTRKLRDVLKREDSSKNILDELVEKTGSESFAENELVTKKREPSKSPFDELLETSIISYEKDSIARSRTRKEIEVTVSMTKNPLFKRSRVFVPKGYNGSTEKEGHSTNVTNSKSTYRNESIQSNLIRDDGSQEMALKKSDTVEIDFGFEDDVSLKKKAEAEPKPHPTRKLLNELNVIDEENQANQKETIIMSQDVISSQEFQKIVGPDPGDNESEKTPTSPSAKTTSVKPMFFYCGQKLNKAPTNKKSTTMSQKLFEDDDICINGENSDCDVVNSRVGLDSSYELYPKHTEDSNLDKHTINVSKKNLNRRY